MQHQITEVFNNVIILIKINVRKLFTNIIFIFPFLFSIVVKAGHIGVVVFRQSVGNMVWVIIRHGKNIILWYILYWSGSLVLKTEIESCQGNGLIYNHD